MEDLELRRLKYAQYIKSIRDKEEQDAQLLVLKRLKHAQIINPSQNKEEQDARTEHNHQHSPFLTVLPPELRNRIYIAAFGGRNLHILPLVFANKEACVKSGYTPYAKHASDGTSDGIIGYKCKVCKDLDSDITTYERTRTPDQAEASVPSYSERHRGCVHQTYPELEDTHFDTMSIGLLRTCRSIYREAGSLLYSENTFSFSHAEQFLPFIRLALGPKQRAAITSSHMHYIKPLPRFNATTRLLGVTSNDNPLALLPALKTLSLSFEVERAEFQVARYLVNPKYGFGFGKRLKNVRVVVGMENLSMARRLAVHGGDHRIIALRNREKAEQIEKQVLAKAQKTGSKLVVDDNGGPYNAPAFSSLEDAVVYEEWFW